MKRSQILRVEPHHIKDLQFLITNKLFNSIHKDYKNSFEHLDYLFVIEYGGIISKRNVFNTEIKDLGIHCHCLVNTTLPTNVLEHYINTCFKKIPNYKIDNISKSNTKEDLLKYFLKQSKSGFLNRESYNYKIVENRIDYFSKYCI